MKFLEWHIRVQVHNITGSIVFLCNIENAFLINIENAFLIDVFSRVFNVELASCKFHSGSQ